MKNKTVMITGVAGQDGSYLTEHLLQKGYNIIGVTRRSGTPDHSRLQAVLPNPRLVLETGDVADMSSMMYLIQKHKPDYIYNLAAQSHVGTSFNQPSIDMDVTGKGCLNILECIRILSLHTKFYQASSSEMFGKSYDVYPETNSLKQIKEQSGDYYQDEDTSFLPQSPYGIAKLCAHNYVRLYRESYGIHACSGILFNHESERRGEEFVTRKITKWIGEFDKWCDESSEACEYHGDFSPYEFDEDNIICYYIGLLPKLRLGNLDAERDWGHAEDYVQAMALMLEHDVADDYVVATGKTYSIRKFLDEAFKCIGIDDWKPYVVIDPKFYRPAEVDYLCGDASKIKDKLGWEPKINFSELVSRMVENDKCLKT